MKHPLLPWLLTRKKYEKSSSNPFTSLTKPMELPKIKFNLQTLRYNFSVYEKPSISNSFYAYVEYKKLENNLLFPSPNQLS